MDLSDQSFCIGDKPLLLTSTEFKFLQLLMENPQRVFSREEILITIGMVEGVATKYIVESHALRIHTRIRDLGGPEMIAIVRNVGFRLADLHPREN